MREKLADEQVMIRYLLGDLPEEEQLRLEERFFSDHEYYQQLLALEDELRYDYAQSELSPRERELFEKRFLTSLEERQKVELAQAVMRKLSQAAAVAPEPVSDRPAAGSWWQSLLAFFALQNPAVRFSLAAAVLVLALGPVWLLIDSQRLRTEIARLQTERTTERQASEQQAAERRARQDQMMGELERELERERKERTQLEQELAKQQAQAGRDTSNPQPSHPTFLAMMLTPGLVRDVEGPKRLLLPAGVDLLRLGLEIRKKGEYRGYRAALQTLDGEEIWSQDLLRARPAASGQVVNLRLPARLLPAGDYMITLKGATAGGDFEEVGDYYFTVVKR
jgi:hypothetical protein